MRVRVPPQISNQLKARIRSDPAAFAKSFFNWIPHEKQAEILKIIRTPENKNITIVAGRRAGKCLDIDEYITLNSGIRVKISELVGKRFDILAYDEKRAKFIKTKAYALNNGVQEVYELTIDGGAILRRTSEHPFLTIMGWTPLSDLVIGEKVAVPLRVDRGGMNAIDENLIKIAAYIIGDGNTTSGNLRFSNGNDQIIQDLNSSLAKYGGTLKQYESCATYDYHIVSINKWAPNPIKNILRMLNLMDKGAHYKRVPAQIMMSPIGQVGLFLNRLFATDGWVDCRGVGYCSVNRDLIDDVFELLLRFGIRARRRQKLTRLNGKTFTSYYLTITDKDSILRFVDEINIFTKEPKLKALANKYKTHKKSESSFRNYDKNIWAFFDNKIARVLRHKYGLRKQYGPTKHVLDKASKDLKISWGPTRNNNIGWAKVLKIKYLGRRPTASIVVPKYNTFITDVIEHNTEVLAIDTLHYGITHPKTNQYIISFTQDQANILFNKIMMFLSLNQDIYNSLVADVKRSIWPELTLVNGSKIYARSAQSGGKYIRGRGASRVILDEAAFIEDMAVEAAISPLLADTGGPMIKVSTPAGRNHFYTSFIRGWNQDGFIPEKGCASIRFPSTVNPHISHTWLEEKKREYGTGSVFWQVEIEANFLDDRASVFQWSWITRAFNNANYPPLTNKQPDEEYVIGVDVAEQKDFNVIATLRINKTEKEDEWSLDLVDMERFHQEGLDFTAKRITEKLEAFKPLKCVIDQTGQIGNPMLLLIPAGDYVVEPFDISPKTKTDLVKYLSTSLERGELHFHWDENIITELKLFQYRAPKPGVEGGRTKYGAPAGRNDDIVMALALAIYAAKTTPRGGPAAIIGAKDKFIEQMENKYNAPSIPDLKSYVEYDEVEEDNISGVVA